MTKKDRVPDLAFYEWSLLRWTTSDTRNDLDCTGIGIYRELLDRCYAQGSIPKDPDKQATIAKCTVDQLTAAWPLIKANFRALKARPDRLENATATVYRTNYFQYLKRQKRTGKTGGLSKASNSKRIASDPRSDKKLAASQDDTTRYDTIRHDTTRHDTTGESPQPPVPVHQLNGEWPETAKLIRCHFPQTDFRFVLKLAEVATVEFLGVVAPRVELTDRILAAAVAHCRTEKQFSPALFLTTVPNCVRSWAENGMQKQTDPAFSDLPRFQGFGEKPIK